MLKGNNEQDNNASIKSEFAELVAKLPKAIHHANTSSSVSCVFIIPDGRVQLYLYI